jgi:hypothetical protein
MGAMVRLPGSEINRGTDELFTSSFFKNKKKHRQFFTPIHTKHKPIIKFGIRRHAGAPKRAL